MIKWFMAVLSWLMLSSLLLLTGCETHQAAEHPVSARPGTIFRDCANCPEMVVIPGGRFMMSATVGAPPGVTPPPAPPPHEVVIGQSFAIGRFEVTRGEFAEFITATGYSAISRCFVFQSVGDDGVGIFNWVDGVSWQNPGYEQSDRHPAVCLSWQDAHAYTGWLSKKTGKKYRLLAESEWAYATSAGTGNIIWWASSSDASASCKYVNAADETFQKKFPSLTNVMPCADGYAFTAPVGTYQPNPFGIYDLLGNAWEWTDDCGGTKFESSPRDGSPDLQGNCDNRVRRSGSWYRSADNNTSALPAADRHGNAGIRVALSLD